MLYLDFKVKSTRYTIINISLDKALNALLSFKDA
jgi:hypothetical protein